MSDGEVLTDRQWERIERRDRKQRAAIRALSSRLAGLDAVTPVFARAGGDALCTCGLIYFDHPEHPSFGWLHILCDGSLVKL